MLLPNLPEPILLHPLKHHLEYIKHFITGNLSAPEAKLKASLLSIGNASQLDVYTGALSARHISAEVILYLQERDLLEPKVYQQYLTSGDADYRLITLSDGTDWVLRWGVVAERHVHLHPARYAARTIRVKANVLKTAIATMLAAKQQGTEINLALMNQVRATWLELPPVKAFSEEAGAAKLMKLLLS